MREMVITVPGIHAEKFVNRNRTVVIRVVDATLKILTRQCAQQRAPASMQGAQQS